MAHDTTPPPAAAGFDWSDPHAFHHDEEGHADDHGHGHVTPWQKLFLILVVLMFLTALTVAAATVEAWAVGMGIHISHFWNVMIALTIAVVKASLVCMYFMHLKHDNPLNKSVSSERPARANAMARPGRMGFSALLCLRSDHRHDRLALRRPRARRGCRTTRSCGLAWAGCGRRR
ncbi:MAG: cytochrome C oxidase subunit IV family protein [Phycisphaerales bacterium]|nr:cytochrome C oxidase subunit IV family protein [Phycisphaerales bacterium]